MNYEELSLSGFVNEIEEVSNGPHPRKFCFILGAGASKSSGIKSGQELVNIWDKELLERNRERHLKWKETLNINEGNKYEFYSQYYERRFKKPIDGYNYLEKLMESAKPSIGYVMLSYILTHTKHNVVITTNFDHIIEDAINYYEHTIPLVIGHESLAHYITKQINRPMIIKIHRDLLLDPKNRTAELDILHDNWKNALDIVFSEYHPIFIGYAGNDHSLMDFLTQNGDKFLEEKWSFPYWMMYKTDKMSKMVSEFLDKSNGYLIKHNGFDEVMYLLGATFKYQLPSKEDFISDAEKRFKMLSDSIDEFTEKASSEKGIEQEEDDGKSGDAEKTSEVDQAIRQITGQTESQDLFRKATSLYNSGKYGDAKKIYETLVGKNPENARYHYYLGATLHKMEKYEETLKELEKASKIDPDNAKYYEALGITLHKMERYDEALKETKKALELDPDNAEYHESLSIILHNMENYAEAMKETEKALELDPNNAKYHDSLSTTLYKMGRFEEALNEIDRALDLDPYNEEYQKSFSETLQAMEHKNETH